MSDLENLGTAPSPNGRTSNVLPRKNGNVTRCNIDSKKLVHSLRALEGIKNDNK